MARYCELFDHVPLGAPVLDPLQTVRVGFVAPRSGNGASVEFIEPTDENSRVALFLKRGGGFHHVCYQVRDLQGELERARAGGALIVQEPVPAVAFDGRTIAWLYTPDRQLVELLAS